MAELSSSVIHKFVDLTSEEDESKGYYSYATGIVNGNDKYVQLDGSDTVASVSLATDLSTGDRVLVYIENHTATVVGNITYPTSGRAVIEINENLLDFEELTVGNFAAIDGQFETIETNYISAMYEVVDYLLAEMITADYILADTIEANYATIYDLTVLREYVDSLEASEITVEYLNAHYADLSSFTALQGSVTYLESQMITTDELEANYAKIADLMVTNENVSNLTADYSDLKYVLAGYESVEDLQSIHLTADNVVIDNAIITDAMIADLSASKLTAGTIYTSLVKIQTAENDTSLYLNDSLIQMCEDDLVRFQAGKDATGEYGLYIWNSEGKIMFDATGATSDGIGAEVIVNDMVADTANIAGYKLDIDSVVSCINDNGNLQVDGSHVTINGSTLDYELDTIIKEIDGLELGEGVTKVIPYFAVSSSPDRPPVSEEDFCPAYAGEAKAGCSYAGVYYWSDTPPISEEDFCPAYAGEAKAGCSYAGVYDYNDFYGIWSTDQPIGTDQYLWVKFKFVYNDDSESWSDPILLSDGYLHTVTTSLQTELKVIQGQINLKVWQTDIDNSVTTAITDLWSEIDIELGKINLSVGNLSSNVDSLSANVSEIELTVNSISLTTSSSGNGMASITLKNGDESSSVDVVEEAAKAFEYDLNNNNSSVEIVAGTVIFDSNTIIINSSNFTLDSGGNVTAKSMTADEAYITNSTAINLTADHAYITESDAVDLNVTGDSYFEGVLYAQEIHLVGTNAYMQFGRGITDPEFEGILPIVIGYDTGNVGDIISELWIGNEGLGIDSFQVAEYGEDGYPVRTGIAVDFEVTPDFIYMGKGDKLNESETLMVSGYGSKIIYIENWKSDTATGIYCHARWSDVKVSLQVGSGGSNRGVYDDTNSAWLVYADSNNKCHLGASTVGSNLTPIYLSSGVPTAVATTVILTSGNTEKVFYYGGGYITSSSTSVYYTVTGKTLTDVSSTSISSWDGAVIRQSGNYCYGSSSSSYVKPSSYSISVNAVGQVRFNLTYGNTTNVSSNNASCGVAMTSATLSFS